MIFDWSLKDAIEIGGLLIVFGIRWATFSARLTALEKTIDRLCTSVAVAQSKEFCDSRHEAIVTLSTEQNKNIADRLSRIENKIDKNSLPH